MELTNNSVNCRADIHHLIILSKLNSPKNWKKIKKNFSFFPFFFFSKTGAFFELQIKKTNKQRRLFCNCSNKSKAKTKLVFPSTPSYDNIIFPIEGDGLFLFFFSFLLFNSSVFFVSKFENGLPRISHFQHSKITQKQTQHNKSEKSYCSSIGFWEYEF